MNVISLFDGMSCGRIALEKVGIKVDGYFASEIDKYAIQISEKNYPDVNHIGDITKIKISESHIESCSTQITGVDFAYAGSKIDLVIGGSPCQSFSVAGDGSGFDGSSKLFWEYVRILKEVRAINPDVRFLLENVVMKKEWEQIITDALGVEPIMINSKVFTAQSRRRLYWTNIPVANLPEDMGLVLGDILENHLSERTVEDTARNLRHEKKYIDKALTCTATMYKGAGNNGMTLIRRRDQPGNKLSVLTVNEVEKLQGVPRDYTEGVSNTQRYKMLGNGWTVDVIAHIFEGLKLWGV